MKIAYKHKQFRAASMAVINAANQIVAEYSSQGFLLTLRQLYYQFVSRDIIENSVRAYKRLGGIVNDARLAGLIDWEAIEDRTRRVQAVAHWESLDEIISGAANQFRIDKWKGQDYRPEVWIEKEALAGVIERVCGELDISFLSCRGYTSQSEMWSSAMRLRKLMEECGKDPIILHLGDHDPSGIDMTRDIRDRLRLFGSDVEVRRLALNMDQIEEHNPPSNPAKTTDSRFSSYRNQFGDNSWELDALEPAELTSLVERNVLALRDDEQWQNAVGKENEMRAELAVMADNCSQARGHDRLSDGKQ